MPQGNVNEANASTAVVGFHSSGNALFVQTSYLPIGSQHPAVSEPTWLRASAPGRALARVGRAVDDWHPSENLSLAWSESALSQSCTKWAQSTMLGEILVSPCFTGPCRAMHVCG